MTSNVNEPGHTKRVLQWHLLQMKLMLARITVDSYVFSFKQARPSAEPMTWSESSIAKRNKRNERLKRSTLPTLYFKDFYTSLEITIVTSIHMWFTTRKKYRAAVTSIHV